MNTRMKNFYMQIAHQCATMSRAERLQVGAIIVKNDNIISFSWNGTPAGWDNNCEDKVWMDSEESRNLSREQIENRWPYVGYPDNDRSNVSRYKLVTKPEVLHAERNSLDKLARGHESGDNASMFITHAPCIECAKSIYGAGITHIYYGQDYRCTSGIDFLKKCNLYVEKMEGDNSLQND